MELLAAANARREARFILSLAQTINAGGMTGKNETYAAKQKALLEQMRSGL